MKAVTEYRLRNDLVETHKIRQFVEEFARRNRLPATVQQALDLALVEWVTNVISYAYEDSREHWIGIRFSRPPGEVQVVVEDDGREFDPLTVPPVDIAAPLETRPIGGLGIHLIRKVMDAVVYRRVNGRNVLTLLKRLPHAEGQALPTPEVEEGKADRGLA